jgi:predicted metal-dependent hydrolase
MSQNEPPHPLRGIPAGDPRGQCDEPAPPALRTAIEQFNARDYFECHETLEALWNAEPGPRRILYKGILQVGVGCYHLLRGNYRGALIKLQTGADYLAAFEPECAGVAVSPLIVAARRLRAAIVARGPEHLREVDLALLPTVHLHDLLTKGPPS